MSVTDFNSAEHSSDFTVTSMQFLYPAIINVPFEILPNSVSIICKFDFFVILLLIYGSVLSNSQINQVSWSYDKSFQCPCFVRAR